MFSGGFFVVRGSGEGIKWENLSMEEFIMREENFHKGGPGFSSII